MKADDEQATEDTEKTKDETKLSYLEEWLQLVEWYLADPDEEAQKHNN